MSAGCDFVCKNESCSCHNTGFVITAPWAMGKIELVLSSYQVKENTEFYNELKTKMKDGKKLCCIPYPNLNKIKTEAYRVQMWSPDAKCIWEFHVSELPNESDKTCNGQVPLKCPTTGCDLLTFQEVVRDGINCPSCGNTLVQNRWFSKTE